MLLARRIGSSRRTSISWSARRNGKLPEGSTRLHTVQRWSFASSKANSATSKSNSRISAASISRNLESLDRFAIHHSAQQSSENGDRGDDRERDDLPSLRIYRVDLPRDCTIAHFLRLQAVHEGEHFWYRSIILSNTACRRRSNVDQSRT
jgi:hypothetical protein